MLGEELTASIAPVVPVDMLDRLHQTRSYNIHIGNASLTGRPDLWLPDILQRTWAQTAGARAAALRQGRIELCARDDGTEVLGRVSAIRCLELTLSLGSRQFFLMEGRWYEIGEHFIAAIRSQVEALLTGPPSLDLLEWERDEHDKRLPERDYNLRVQHVRGRRHYLCLDRKLVRDELHRYGFEACDLLGPTTSSSRSSRRRAHLR